MKEYMIWNYVIRKDLNYIEIFYIEYILRNKVFIFQKISTLRIICVFLHIRVKKMILLIRNRSNRRIY